MVPWYITYAQPLIALIVFVVVGAPPAWFGAAALKQFNSHVKDKRVREKATQLAKYADKWLESAQGKTDADKAQEVIANLMGEFGIPYAEARQATEAAVYDIHDAVHQIGSAELLPMEPATLIQGAPLVDHEKLAQDVAKTVVKAIGNDVIAAQAMVAEGSPVAAPVVSEPPTAGGLVSPSGEPLAGAPPAPVAPSPVI